MSCFVVHRVNEGAVACTRIRRTRSKKIAVTDSYDHKILYLYSEKVPDRSGPVTSKTIEIRISVSL